MIKALYITQKKKPSKDTVIFYNYIQNTDYFFKEKKQKQNDNNNNTKCDKHNISTIKLKTQRYDTKVESKSIKWENVSFKGFLKTLTEGEKRIWEGREFQRRSTATL